MLTDSIFFTDGLKFGKQNKIQLMITYANIKCFSSITSRYISINNIKFRTEKVCTSMIFSIQFNYKKHVLYRIDSD